MTEQITGPLTAPENTLVREWTASQGPVGATYRVTWNGAPAFAAMVRSGVALVRADDSGAAAFRRSNFTLTAPDATTLVLTAARDLSVDGEPARQLLVFDDAAACSAFDRIWRAGLVSGATTADDLDRSVSFLGNFSSFTIGLGVVVAVLGVIGSFVLFAHTDGRVDGYGNAHHDLIGYGLTGLLSTAVTASLLVGVGAIGRVVALKHRVESARGDR